MELSAVESDSFQIIACKIINDDNWWKVYCCNTADRIANTNIVKYVTSAEDHAQVQSCAPH